MKLVDQILKLSKEIIALEQQEKRLRALRERKKLELAALANSEPGATAQVESPGRAGTLTVQVMAVLLARAGEQLTVDDIRSQLSGNSDENSVRTALSRLKQSGQVINPERGRYTAAEAVATDKEEPQEEPATTEPTE